MQSHFFLIDYTTHTILELISDVFAILFIKGRSSPPLKISIIYSVQWLSVQEERRMALGNTYLLPPLPPFRQGTYILVKAKTACNLTCNSDGL